LLITITLIAFLVLILVGLASFTRVETQVANNTQQMAQARQNALMALNIAMGELQRTAGPDQRVTAKADILPATVAAKQNWTGVWSSGASATATQWLASGAKTGTGAIDTNAHAAPLSANAVELVGSGSATGTEYESLVAVEPELILSTSHPALPETSVAIGRMAYWVGDEGVKARVNLRDPYVRTTASTKLDSNGNPVVPAFTPTAAQRRARLAVAQRFGIEKIATNAAGTDYLGSTVFPVGTDSTDTAITDFIERATAVTDDGQIGFLSGMPAALRKNRFHDLTAYSHGLLTNTVAGGLREDLTHLFELPTANAFTTALTNNSVSGLTPSVGNTPVFQGPEFTVAGEVLNGPTWEQLRSYYRIKDTLGGAQVAIVRPQTAAQHGIAPVLTQFRMMSGISFFRQAPNQNIPRIHMQFAMVLANPYDVRIEGTDVAVMVSISSAMGYEVVNDSSAAGMAPTAGNFAHYRVWQAVQGIRFNIPSLSLAPGEARVFMPRRSDLPGLITWDGSFYGFSTANANSPLTVEMENVWDYSAANSLVYQPLLTPATGLTDAQVGGTPLWFRTFGPTGNWGFSVLDSGGTVLQRLVGATLDANAVHNVNCDRDMTVVAVGASSSMTETGGWGYSLLGPWHGNAQYAYIGQTDLRSPFYSSSAKTTGSNWTTIMGARGRDRFTDEMGGTNIDPAAPNDLSGTPRVSWGPYTERQSSPGRPAGWAAAAFQFQNPIYSLPRDGLVSIGQLVHANLGGWTTTSPTTYTNGDRYESANSAIPSFVIGNSYASPLIRRDATKHAGANEWDPHVRDASYFANKALWDGYFFSSVPQSGLFDFTADRLPNSRLKPFGSTLDVADYRSDKFAVARQMMVAGAFNINSTSKQAWRALLGSLRGAELSGEADLNAPLPRTLYPVGGSVGVTTITNPNATRGFRNLTDPELDLLAAAIIAEIKARAAAYGPSRSLAEFINRRLEAVGSARAGFGAKGILQTALDNTVNGSNYNLQTDTGNAIGMPEPTNKLPQRLAGLPGWLLQSDLLQPLGPVMTARSDTFRIRARGDAINPVLNTAASPAVSPESIAASAWCEAIVQRLPEYVKPGEHAADALPSSLSGDNLDFGRRFHVVSFRWLSPGEL
jgi:hypothetical protein